MKVCILSQEEETHAHPLAYKNIQQYTMSFFFPLSKEFIKCVFVYSAHNAPTAQKTFENGQ